MLEVTSLSKKLNEQVFQFNLTLAAGECLAVLGESGCGKSTLLNLIGGFLSADSGSIRWQAKEIISLPPYQRPITSLFQDHNLFAHLSIFDNVALGIHPGLRLSAADKKKVADSLDAVGIAKHAARKPAELSGGQIQRAALARSLLRKQPVLLLDEPFSALDEATRAQMLALCRDVIDSQNLCALVVTHNRSDATALNARIVTIKGGMLV